MFMAAGSRLDYNFGDATTAVDPNALAIDYTVGQPATGATPDAANPWVTGISNILTQGLSLYGQLRLQDMNMNLIQQGKPPLTAAQVASMAPQLNVGIASGTQNMLMYAAMGGGAILLLSILMKSKRARR
jgi:hypothetical protein